MTFCVVDCNVDSLSGFPHRVLPGCIHPLPPQPAAESMVKHLRSLTEQRLIMSFTPKSPLLVLLKGIG